MKKIQVAGLVAVMVVVVVGSVLLKRAGWMNAADTRLSEPTVAAATGDGSSEAPGGVTMVEPPVDVSEETAPARESHQQILDAKLATLNMSPVVRTLLGLNGDKGDREARRGALKKLTRTLSADDTQAISVFLDFRHEDNPELPSATLDALKNDALVVLFNQQQVPDGLGSQLATMFQDEAHGTRWRDYSLQYLSRYYEEVTVPGDAARSEITNAYAVALESHTEKFAGTALLALERLSREHAEFDRQAIGDQAVGIALAGDSCQDSRITALRVCAMMDRTEILPEARILAQTGATVPLRLAAIATVGDLGDESDLEFIEALSASEDRRLQRISKTASAKLRKRLEKAADPQAGI